MEDHEIIKLYFDRSENAVGETDSKYGKFLSTLAYNILRSREDTEEILNDTYMGAWNAMPPTKPKSLRHFLSRITRNLSFDRLDYRNAGKRSALEVELNECIPAPHGVEDTLELREIGVSLDRFLTKADDKTCAVFLGRYYYSQSIAALAKKYALSERQVTYTLGKARSALRAHFEKEGIMI